MLVTIPPPQQVEVCILCLENQIQLQLLFYGDWLLTVGFERKENNFGFYLTWLRLSFPNRFLNFGIPGKKIKVIIFPIKILKVFETYVF